MASAEERMGRSWETIAGEYDLARGGLMPVGLAILAMTPWIAWRLRQAAANH